MIINETFLLQSVVAPSSHSQCKLQQTTAASVVEATKENPLSTHLEQPLGHL